MPSTYYDPKQGRIVTSAEPSLWEVMRRVPQHLRDAHDAHEATLDQVRHEAMAPRQSPPLPGAPKMRIANPWQPERRVDDLLAPAAPPEPPARPGITVTGSPDWAAERAGFLARGRSPQIAPMADALDARDAIEDNATSGRRPDLLAQMQTQLALRGLRSARARDEQQILHADPAFQRAQIMPDADAEAAASLSPVARQARGLRDDEALEHARATAEQSQDLRMAPQELSRLLFDFELRRRLTEIESQGRSPLAGLLGGAGTPPPPTGTGGAPRVGQQRQTRDGRIVVWDGQGWAYQE